MEIDLVPFVAVDGKILSNLRDDLHRLFGCAVIVVEPIPAPDKAFARERKQYLSDMFIGALEARCKAGPLQLGITELDLFTEGLNFVFGQADQRGGAAVISLHLLRQEHYGLPADGGLLAERALKEAVHEIGHLLGMPHCPDGTCVMHFSNSLLDTDVKGTHFCTRCQPKLPL